MNRRQFAQGMASAALAASTLRPEAEPAPQPAATPFPLSVMLWTVFNELPFEQRLAKVAEAGYTNIELVGEYAKWSEADFARAVAAAKQLGIHFDATAGLHNGVANPAVRDAFLDELKAALAPMERLSCPAMIVLSGVAGGLSWIFVFRAIALADVSKVAPIDKLSLPLGILLAVIVLRERPTLINWLGIVMITAGAYLAVMKNA